MNRLVKTLIASLSAVVLVGTSLVAANAAGWDFPSTGTVPSDATGVAVNEPSYFDQWNVLQAVQPGADWSTANMHRCPNGIDTEFCDPDNARINAVSLLPACESATSENCIESLTLIDAAGVRHNGNFVKQIDGEKFDAIAAQNLIGGSTVSIWDVPEMKNKGGTSTYSVAAKLNQQVNLTTRKFVASTLNVVVNPFSLRPGGTPARTEEKKEANGTTKIYQFHDSSCLWGDSTGCGMAEDFADDVRVELSVRVPKTISGWFRGRIKAPEADIASFSTSNSRIVMAGQPVSVPRMFALATKANTSVSGEAMLLRTGGKNPNQAPFTGKSIRDFWANGQEIFSVIDEFREAAKDTAAGISSLWNFSTIETKSDNKCLSDNSRVLGIVTTNATGYDGAVPEFFRGQMTYQVTGLHYAPDGQELNLGSYDLLMRSDVARCLYKFTAAPVSASITVVNDGVNKAVGTSVLKEKNGWLRLSAYGFTFSSPTINIKLTQKNKFAKTTITCIKKNVTKKVTGVGPKCPTGYKEK
jgi:hypothetical protein